MALYAELLKCYGYPGPWPWFEMGKIRAHDTEEIAISAILTQNTAWRNVECALKKMRDAKCSSLQGVYEIGKQNIQRLKKYVRPSGFYNQKAERLFLFTQYIIENFVTFKKFLRLPLAEARKNLLTLKGIGKETADTILLYCGNKPIFVIDSYTKRMVLVLKISRHQEYDKLQQFFTNQLPRNAKIYQAFHALIIRWGQNYKK